MLRHALAIPALLAILGCAAAEVPPQPQSSPSRVEPYPALVASTAEILGRWDVVSFESYEPVQRLGAYAVFTESGVRLRLDCNHSSVPGSVVNGRFVSLPGPRLQTEMGCGPEREERDSRYFSFFDRSPVVELLADSRLRLADGVSVLIMERPEKRRLAFVPPLEKLRGKWRMETLTQYELQGGESGIGLSEVPGHILINEHRLVYDRCPAYALDFMLGSDGRLTKLGGVPIAAKPDCPDLQLPWPTTGMPTPDLVIPLLHANPWVESLGPERILISNERLGLIISRQ